MTQPVECPFCQESVDTALEVRSGELRCGTCGRNFTHPNLAETQVREAVPRGRIGHFELRRQLGKGTFGTVWLADDTELGRPVAIKIPRDLDSKPADFYERVYGEARAAAQLRHPNIVAVHEIENFQGLPIIVTDFVDGVTLKDHLTSGQLSIDEAVALTRTIAEALHHAHSAGVIHRDLKPGNILLDARQNPHIADFGLAKVETAESDSQPDPEIMGTPAYMSPEQADGRAVDRRTDIYSLGIILFELLTRHRPFRGNPRMLMFQAINADPPSPRDLEHTLPKDLNTICVRCMQKSPAARYATAAEVDAELERFQNGEPILARPVSRAEKLWRLAKRHRLITILVTGLFVSLTTGLAGVSYQWQRAETARGAAETARGDLAKEVARKNRLLYDSRMKLVQQAWQLGDYLRMRRLLREFLPTDNGPDLRDLEWYVFRAEQQRLIHQVDHGESVQGVAVSGDGSLFASAGLRSVKLWDMQTGAPQQTLPHKTRVEAVAFSPTNSQVATLSGAVVRVWNTRTGQLVFDAKVPGAALCVAYRHDGSQLAVGTAAGLISLLDASDGSEQTTIDAHRRQPVNDLKFSSDDRYVLSGGGDGKVCLWQADDGSAVRDWNGHRAGVSAVAIADSVRYVACVTLTSDLIVWDLEGTALPARVIAANRNGPAGELEFLSDDELASANIDGRMHVWDLRTGQEMLSIQTHKQSKGAFALSRNRDRFVAGSGTGMVLVLRFDTRTERRVIAGHRGPVTAMSFLENGLLLTSGQDGTMRLADTRSGTFTRTLIEQQHAFTDLAVAPDGRVAAVADAAGGLHLWSFDSEQVEKTLAAGPKSPWTLAFSPDGSELAATTSEGVIRIFKVPAGELTNELAAHDGGIRALQFSPDGKRLYWCSSVRIGCWDREKAAALWNVDFPGARVTVLSPDGESLALGGQDGTIATIDARTGQTRYVLEGHAGPVQTMFFTETGQTLVSGGNDRVVRWWDLKTGESKAAVEWHERAVWSLALAADGQSMASADANGLIKLWRADRQD